MSKKETEIFCLLCFFRLIISLHLEMCYLQNNVGIKGNILTHKVNVVIFKPLRLKNNNNNKPLRFKKALSVKKHFLFSKWNQHSLSKTDKSRNRF